MQAKWRRLQPQFDTADNRREIVWLTELGQLDLVPEFHSSYVLVLVPELPPLLVGCNCFRPTMMISVRFPSERADPRQELGNRSSM